MDPNTVTAMIRYIAARTYADASKVGHGTLYRKFQGSTFSQLRKNSAFIAPNPAYLPSTSSREEAVVFLWTFIKKPATSKDIFFEQGKSIAKAFMMPVIGNASGGVVASVAGGYGLVKDVEAAGNAAGGAVGGQGRASAAAGIASGLNLAWRAGYWSSLDLDKWGFTMSMDETMYACGIGVYSETGNKGTISLRLADDKSHFLGWMRAAENTGREGSSTWGNYLFSYVNPGKPSGNTVEWTYDSVKKLMEKVGT